MRILQILLTWCSFYSVYGHICRLPARNSLKYGSVNIARSERAISQPYLKFLINYLPSLRNHEMFEDIKQQIILPATQFWEDAIKIKNPSSRNLYINRDCVNDTTGFYNNNGNIVQYCEYGCKERTFCSLAEISSDYLYDCKEEASDVPVTDNIPGQGLAPNEFLLYIGKNKESDCSNSDSIAHGVNCHLEPSTDRPISGYVGICVDERISEERKIRGLLSTVKHELVHVLGFSDDMYAFLRDENGLPRTPRHTGTGLPNLGQTPNGVYIASTSTVSTSARVWRSAKTTITREVRILTLPTLLSVIREHYDCSTMDGMEIEDQGGNGTANSHFKQRLAENELMAGSSSAFSYVSNLTLAYLHDTGWYVVDFSIADDWKWGKGMGCDFALKSCYDYMKIKVSNNESITPFCNKVDKSAHCLAYENGYGYCDLQKRDTVLPLEFQYFDSIDGIDSTDFGYYGGESLLSDACPLIRINIGSNMNEYPICSEEEAQYTLDSLNWESNVKLQYFGEDSVCVEHVHQRNWTVTKNDLELDLSYPSASCHKYRCSSEYGLSLIFGSTEFICPTSGGPILLNTVTNCFNLTASGICPPCQTLCSTCPYVTSSVMTQNIQC